MATKVEKGVKNEKQAAKIAYHNYRMVDRLDKVSTPYNGNNDMFRYADLAVMNRNEPITLIQVKTNSWGDKDYYINKALLLHSEHVKCELWIKKTNLRKPEWHLYRFNGVTFKKYLESDSLNIHLTGKKLVKEKQEGNFNEV
jgi:hypothetical protein